MVAEGTAPMVFFDGTIKCEDDFLSAMKLWSNLLYIIYKENTPVALCWLNQFKNRTCYFHFNCFSPIWGDADECGKYVLRKMITMKDADGDYIFDMFIGLVQTSNKLAIDYVTRIGAVYLGELPLGIWNYKKQRSESATLVYYMREEDKNEDL